MKRVWWLALVATLFVFGCTDNAVLELTVEVPAAPADRTEPLFAFLEVNDSATVVDAETEFRFPDTPDGVQLGAEVGDVAYSVVASPAQYESDVLVSVRYCVDRRCNGFGDEFTDRIRFRIERPFFDGVRTRIRLELGEFTDEVSDEETAIDQCSVEGCGDPGLASYCDATGTHLCGP
ncbi:MAG: hypothetical protein AAF411_23170 [Myxococcota bacterium]